MNRILSPARPRPARQRLVMTLLLATSFSASSIASSASTSDDFQTRSVVDGFVQAMQNRDVEKLKKLYADDVRFRDVNMRTEMTDSETLLEHFGRFWSVHSAFDFKVKTEVLTADSVALHVVWTGTIPAAVIGKAEDCSYEISGMMLLEIEDGRIARQTDFIDLRTYIELFGPPQ